MKITKSKLKKLIKEELEASLDELRTVPLGGGEAINVKKQLQKLDKDIEWYEAQNDMIATIYGTHPGAAGDDSQEAFLARSYDKAIEGIRAAQKALKKAHGIRENKKLFEDNMEDMVADALAKMEEDGATDIDQYLTDNPELGYTFDMEKDQEFRHKLKMALKGEEAL